MFQKVHNPLGPMSLANECKKAERILDSFINPDVVTLDKRVPPKVLENAKGLAILSVLEVGMVRSLRYGSGVVVARLPDGTWSAPSAIATGKLRARGSIGMEFTDFVLVLNTDAAVEHFTRRESFTLGETVAVAIGPFGRSAELAGTSYRADIFAYCKTRTVFGGYTLEGATIGERVDANRKMYQKDVTAEQLLAGDIELPPETYPLMKILHSTLLRPVSRRSSVDTSKLARNVPQAQVTELPAPLGRAEREIPQITIQITDWSKIERLPDPSEILEKEPDGFSASVPARHPTVLKPGRRSWSGASSYYRQSRHDPLPF